MSELDLKPLQLSSQTATTAAPRVQESHWTVPSYSGRGLHQPCQEQEPEHCSAVCQETTRTAALKLNVARETFIIIIEVLCIACDTVLLFLYLYVFVTAFPLTVEILICGGTLATLTSYSVHAEFASSPPPSSFVGIVSSGFNTDSEDSDTFSSSWVSWVFP